MKRQYFAWGYEYENGETQGFSGIVDTQTRKDAKKEIRRTVDDAGFNCTSIALAPRPIDTDC